MPTPPSWLARDTGRHAASVAVMSLAAVAAFVLIPPPPDRLGRALMGPASAFAALAVYGPLYLALTSWALRDVHGAGLRDWLLGPDRAGRGWVDRLLVGGPRTMALSVSFVALMSVLMMTVVARDSAPLWLSLSGIACVLGCWTLLLGVFATEYARAWARDGALRFPDDDAERAFSDFVYVAAQVATTFATSDVEVLGRRTRQTVTVHTLTSWLFSTVIVALVVSLALPSGG